MADDELDVETIDLTAEEVVPTLDPRFDVLPTGKQHVSFSELRSWQDCSWRHRLRFVKGIDLDRPGPHADFGKAVHASCENYLKTRIMDPSIADRWIDEAWERNAAHKGFEESGKAAYKEQAAAILAEVPGWLDVNFPNWEFVDAEHMLYEPVPGTKFAFKGYIDAIIRCKDKKGKKDVIWLLDWKTTSWGWAVQKKSDPKVKMQLTLYKSFWSEKTGTDPKDVKCGFVLLKRTGKDGARCELVSSGAAEVTVKRSLKLVNDMFSSVKRGVAIKNRDNCLYCDYKNTEHCK